MLSLLKSYLGIPSLKEDKKINQVISFIIPFIELSQLRVSVFLVCKRWQEEVRKSLYNIQFESPETWWLDYIRYFREYNFRLNQWLSQKDLKEKTTYQQNTIKQLIVQQNNNFNNFNNKSHDNNRPIWKFEYHEVKKSKPRLILLDEDNSQLITCPEDVQFVMREAKSLQNLTINFLLTMDIVNELKLFQNLEHIENLKIDQNAHLDLKLIFHLFKKVKIRSIEICGGRLDWNSPYDKLRSNKSIENLPFIGLDSLKCGSYWENNTNWYKDENLVKFATLLLKQQSMRDIKILDFPQYAYKKLLARELSNQPYCDELLIYIRKDEVYDYQRQALLTNSNPKYQSTDYLDGNYDDNVPILKLLSKEFENTTTLNLNVFKLNLPLGSLDEHMLNYIQQLESLQTLSIVCKETQFLSSIDLHPLSELLKLTLENCFDLIRLGSDALEYLYLNFDVNEHKNGNLHLSTSRDSSQTSEVFNVNLVTRFYCISQLTVGITDSEPRRWPSEQLQREIYSESMFVLENLIQSNPVTHLTLTIDDSILASNNTLFENLYDCIDLEELNIYIAQTSNFFSHDANKIQMNLKGILPSVLYFSIYYKYITIQQVALFALLLPNVQIFQFNEFDTELEEIEFTKISQGILFQSFLEIKKKYPTFSIGSLFKQFLEDLLQEVKLSVSEDEYEATQIFIQEQIFDQFVDISESQDNYIDFDYLDLPPAFQILYYCFEEFYSHAIVSESDSRENQSNSEINSNDSEDMWEILDDNESFY